jgi:hypothetical protein
VRTIEGTEIASPRAESAVEDIARVCHEANRAYCHTIGDPPQPAWDDAPDWQKESARAGVIFQLNNPRATPADSHNSWLSKKLADGWRYGPVKDAEAKTHPCVRVYEDLPIEQQQKDALFTAIVRTMISGY